MVISGETAWIRNVRLPPEGLCGFEPSHLPQATGFAGGSVTPTLRPALNPGLDPGLDPALNPAQSFE